MQYAHELLTRIDEHMAADSGASFRSELRKWMPTMEDAYREHDPPIRWRLGASTIGHPCLRVSWYTYHWWGRWEPKPRMLRLLNRGHIEEARVLALLSMLPEAQVWAADKDGKQFHRSAAEGRFGSTLDAIVLGIEPYPTERAQVEIKTCNRAQFEKLVRHGVKKHKPEHYAQIQAGTLVHGLARGLYLAVCKDDDELYGEWVARDRYDQDCLKNDIHEALDPRQAPERIAGGPDCEECRYCTFRAVCHQDEEPPKSCRTCQNYSIFATCELDKAQTRRIPLETVPVGCDKWQLRRIA